MSKKISELTDAASLDGTEQVELVQAGVNVKATVNDLLPVELQESKTIDLGGNSLQIKQDDDDFLLIDPNGQSRLRTYFDVGDGNRGIIEFTAEELDAEFDLNASFNNDAKLAQVLGNVTGTSASLTYSADVHTFNGIINLPTQSAPASPNDGDIWREDNTNTGLKIRINGVTKTITVS